VIEDLAGDWRQLDARVEGPSSEIDAPAQQDQACVRLMSVPGIGPIISSAMVAATGTGDVSSKGLDGRPDNPRQHIKARQSLSARSLRSGRLGGAGQAGA
jgi:transposase